MVCQLPTEPCFTRCPRRDSNPQSLGPLPNEHRAEPLSQLAYQGVPSSVIPDGLEPSLSGCRPEVVAAGPRDQSESGLIGNRTPCISFPGDRARFAGPMSSCWTMSPSYLSSPSGSRGTRTHKRAATAACFQDRFLIRPDDFRNRQVAGVGIEPTPPGSEPSIATSSDNPAMDVRRRTQLSGQRSRTAGAGIEPADSWFKATNFYQQKLPRNGTLLAQHNLGLPLRRGPAVPGQGTSRAIVSASWRRSPTSMRESSRRISMYSKYPFR